MRTKNKPVDADESAPFNSAERTPQWRDPGLRVPQARIDACIDRIFGDAPRLGAEALKSEAA